MFIIEYVCVRVYIYIHIQKAFINILLCIIINLEFIVLKEQLSESYKERIPAKNKEARTNRVG